MVFAFASEAEAPQMPLSSLLLGKGHGDSPVKACHLQARACQGYWTEERNPLPQQGWSPSLEASAPHGEGPVMLTTGVGEQQPCPRPLPHPQSLQGCMRGAGLPVHNALRLRTRALTVWSCVTSPERPAGKSNRQRSLHKALDKYRLMFLSSPVPSPLRDWG